jgi:hypothetical protein
LFEILNLSGERRLGDVETSGGPAEMQFLGQGYEALQLVKLEH